MNPVGLYIHVPFCTSKCRYCDFYSLCDAASAPAYARQVARQLHAAARRYPRRAETLYFGGGTPPMLGADGIEAVIHAARDAFDLAPTAEITCEMNPGSGYPATVEQLAAVGVNRLSIGLQSALPDELTALGRRHSPQDAATLVARAKAAGIGNISLDLMWGIPGQTVASALQSLAFALSLAPTHISAYMLKIEPDTPFGRQPPVLPDEQTVCEIYETCCEQLEQAGYPRYEISNFARPGFESRHNLKYWNCEETLGLGPAAHSFMEGKRFYYPRDLAGFMAGNPPQDDGAGGDFTEYAMLQLRLRSGLRETACRLRYGHPIPLAMRQTAESLARHGLMSVDRDGIRLTTKGNLVSNEILARLL